MAFSERHTLDGINDTDDGSTAHCYCGLSFFVPALITGSHPPQRQESTYSEALERHREHEDKASVCY